MDSVRIWDGIRVDCYKFTHTFENQQELWEAINVTAEAFGSKEIAQECQLAILQKLSAFGTVDLSEAYAGHKMVLTVVPVKEEE